MAFEKRKVDSTFDPWDVYADIDRAKEEWNIKDEKRKSDLSLSRLPKRETPPQVSDRGESQGSTPSNHAEPEKEEIIKRKRGRPPLKGKPVIIKIQHTQKRGHYKRDITNGNVTT